MKKQKTDKALTTGLLKAPSDYYTVRMMFNMTIEEKRMFEGQMAACGYTSPQRFFREVLLRRKRVKAEKSAVPPTIKEMNPQDVKLLIQELKRIGNNVNQAVRNLNTRMEWMQYNSRAEEDWGTLERDVNSMSQFTDRIDKTCTLFGLYLDDNAI